MFKKILFTGVLFVGMASALMADSYTNTINSTASSAVSGKDASSPFLPANEDSPAVIILTSMTTPEILFQVTQYVNGDKPFSTLEITRENNAQYIAAAKIIDLTIAEEDQQNSTFQVRYTALLKADDVAGHPHFNTAINAFSTPPADEQDPLFVNELDNLHPGFSQMDPQGLVAYKARMNLFAQKSIQLHPEFAAVVKKVAQMFANNIENLQTILTPPRSVIYSGTSGTGKSTTMHQQLPGLDLDAYIPSTDNFTKALKTEFGNKIGESHFFYFSVCMRREFDIAIKQKYPAPSLIQELWLIADAEIANVFKNPLPVAVNDFDGDLRLISLRTIFRARSPGGRPTFAWSQMVKGFKDSRLARPKVHAGLRANDTYQLQHSYNDGSIKVYSLEEARELVKSQTQETLDAEIASVGESIITPEDIARFGDAIKEFEGMKIADAFELAKFPVKSKPQATSEKRFTILFTGDMHSHLENTQAIAHRILMEKQNPENGPVIVADVGDMLTGTEYFEVSKGALEIEMMNLSGYDIATIGNHEFDIGWDNLKPLLEKFEFDVVCANITDETNTLIAKPYKIVPMGHVNVAFVGIMGTDAWNSIRPTSKIGLNLLDPDDVLDELLPQLGQAADVIVLLSHSGVVADRKFAAKHGQLDVVLGGHSHTYMAEPELVQVLGDSKKVPVFHAFKNGEYVGKMTIDIAGKEKKYSTDLFKMDSSQEPQEGLSVMEAQIRDRLLSVKEQVEVIYSRVIAECYMPLLKADIKESVGPLGRDFICHIFRDVTQADAVFYPTGGIRSGVEKGPITLRMIVGLIFSDRLVTYEVKGSWLRQLMEDGERRWAGKMRTFQTSGIEIDQALQITINGESLKDEAIYRVSGPAFFFERELMDANGNHLEKYADVVNFQFEEYPDDTRTIIIDWLKENDLPPYIQRVEALQAA